jgi:hypothetical protein
MEEVTLYCEDRANGLTSKLVEAALQSLGQAPELGFAKTVRPRGSSSKNDVLVWTKLARQQKERAIGLRDRDFLLRPLVDQARLNSFHRSHEHVKPWPLPRHCIESYLLDEDVLCAVLPAVAIPPVTGATLRKIVEECSAARRWLDVARGTLEDFHWRWRNVERRSIEGRPPDRPSAIAAVRDAARQIREQAAAVGTNELLDKHFDALAEDMESDGPLWHRVDGKELVRDVELVLVGSHEGDVPRGGLLAALTHHAKKQPPAALLADLRSMLNAIPADWRLT